jgi:beta-galactosidase
MRNINIDREWEFTGGSSNGMDSIAKKRTSRIVNLPHDYMIEQDVTNSAPAGPAMGYYTAGVAHYTKKILIPESWKDEIISLSFDGVMMNATIDINGCFAAIHHYGYSPFTVDITPYVYFGETNRITITTNPSMQPNSRWYTGAGIFRSVELIHTPTVCLSHSGIYGYTKSIEYDDTGKAVTAFLATEVHVSNHTNLNQIAMVEVFLTDVDNNNILISRKQKIQINPNSNETAYIPITLDYPELWSVDNPNLYRLHARVTTLGTFGSHFVPSALSTSDEADVLFGIRTISADAKYGLRINNIPTKLKGGCLHHDNGPIGAGSFYDSELRKLKRMKEIGFNAIRTAHNPPSSALMEACDRLGMYVFSEAFDVWGMMKQPGDYSMFFATDWEEDLTSFIKRDRNHPSVIIWSTGNEILEHGGLNNGYTLSTKLATTIHTLDSSRPVSNGICSYWTGLDDKLSAEQVSSYEKIMQSEYHVLQYFSFDAIEDSWEDRSEAFVNGLDIVGYNYLEDKYLKDHELYPERVMLGSESYPKEIGKRWPMVEKTPYVIGDFTWTAWDYIGEAGIGKSIMAEPNDPILKKGPYELMSHTSEFPWRTANDADIDITGNILPQGYYRSVVWGSTETYLFSYNPDDYDKVEMTSMWGFMRAINNWTWDGAEGCKVKLVVFSRADEVELFVNDVSIGKKCQYESLATDSLPYSFVFDTVYTPGIVTAVSYNNGLEVSRGTLVTSGHPYDIRLETDRSALKADGHSICYVDITLLDNENRTVTSYDLLLKATLEGPGELLGFGSANPITDENYSAGEFHTYHGKAVAIIRSGYETGEITLSVFSELLDLKQVHIAVL